MATNTDNGGGESVLEEVELEGNSFHEIADAIERQADQVMVSRDALVEVYGTAVRLLAANNGSSAELAKVRQERDHLLHCGHAVLDIIEVELDPHRAALLLKRTLANAEGKEVRAWKGEDANDPRPID